MPEKTSFMTWAKENYPEIRESLRRARIMIILTTLVFTAAGATVGKLSTSAKSTALLVVAPMPFLDSPAANDAIARMLAGKINVKTVVLLCTSDATYQATFESLNESGSLSAPLKSLTQLKNALTYEITIEKETPYDLNYSPVVALTAKARRPSDAHIMVNTWAEACEEATKRYQETFHLPSVNAFEAELTSVFERYDKAQKDYAKFQNENILKLLEARLGTAVSSIAGLESSRTTLLQNITQGKARIESLQTVLQDEEPKITVDWKPSRGILAALAGSLGVTEGLSGSQGAESGPSLLQIEHINDNYMTLRGDLSAAHVNVAAEQAGIENLDHLIALRSEELDDYQAEWTAATIGDARLKTIAHTYGDAYANVLGKKEFAQIAKKLAEVPQVRVLSKGAEWRVPRFRWAILLGFGAGFCGFVLAAGYSILMRLVVVPALRD